MAKQSIKLKIANKPYSFSIESEKEELYRLAEREVNEYITSIKRNNFQGWTDVDYLGMAVLKFAIKHAELRQSREIGDEDLRELKRLETVIDDYLSRPEV